MSQTQRYRHVDFPVVLYESLRAYYSVNSEGKANWLYKLCAANIQPMQSPWNTYESLRATNGLIAGGKFQIGDLTNILNYLYDNTLNRIFITQGFYEQTVVREFGSAIAFGRKFGETPIIFAREFGDPVKFVGAVIHVPAASNVSQITATVAQMAIQGLVYSIITF